MYNNQQQPAAQNRHQHTHVDGERAHVTHIALKLVHRNDTLLCFLWATQFVLCVFGQIHAREINIRTRQTTTTTTNQA